MEWKKATCNGNKDFELWHCEASKAYDGSIAQGPVLLKLTPPSFPIFFPFLFPFILTQPLDLQYLALFF